MNRPKIIQRLVYNPQKNIVDSDFMGKDWNIMKQKHFVNLTNGIEHIESILAEGQEVHFVRVQSTTIERKDWFKLFNDLDHNLLMYMALGYNCYFYDCGTNRPLSKTCYFAIPLINYILKRRWTGEIGEAVRYSRNGQHTFKEDDYYDHIYHELFHYNQTQEKRSLKRKLDYYKRYVIDMGILIPISMSTDNDGKYVFYSNIVNKLL